MANYLFFFNTVNGKWVFSDQEIHIVSFLLLIKNGGNGFLDSGKTFYFYSSLKEKQ